MSGTDLRGTRVRAKKRGVRARVRAVAAQALCTPSIVNVLTLQTLRLRPHTTVAAPYHTHSQPHIRCAIPHALPASHSLARLPSHTTTAHLSRRRRHTRLRSRRTGTASCHLCSADPGRSRTRSSRGIPPGSGCCSRRATRPPRPRLDACIPRCSSPLPQGRAGPRRRVRARQRRSSGRCKRERRRTRLATCQRNLRRLRRSETVEEGTAAAARGASWVSDWWGTWAVATALAAMAAEKWVVVTWDQPAATKVVTKMATKVATETAVVRPAVAAAL